ncbi:Glycogenin-1 [Taenia crassiceps]|uniref:glycogenin glucosyltransferase n=1 Tax=Taenia crassiceps TaxID=6207 RepID=A0ABR4QTR4_9CEST
MDSQERHSYVTLSTNDEYAVGALVLGHSLRRSGTSMEITVLVTEGVSQGFREILRGVYDNIIVVKPILSFSKHNLCLLGRSSLAITYTKLYCWKLVQFSKCVFLDADTIVLQNIDELFEREELSAASDISWPDMFNSGVFVFRPSLKTFSELSNLATTKDSFDGGDQGLLNEYFSGWSTESLDKHLPFVYNCSCWVTPNDRFVFYTRAPAWRKFGNQVKVAHFAGFVKPWKYCLAANNAAICHAIERLESSNTNFTNAEQISVLALWWAIFFKRVKPHLSYGMFLSTTFEPVPFPSPPPTPVEDYASQCQDQNQFYFENDQYHPEFHDTSFDHLHSGQRVDKAKRFEEYYVYEEPRKSVESPYQRYSEGRMEHKRHELHCYQQPTHHEHEQNQQQHYSQPTPQKYHQEHYDSVHQDNFLPEQQQHQQNEKHCQDQDYQQQKQWHYQTHHKLASSPLPSVQDRVKTERNAPTSPSPMSIQPHSMPETPDVRNDKDPLFFAPDPMCCECLKELQWSRQFVDPFHRRLISPMSSLSVATRVRRRSVPLLPLGPQLIRGPQKLTIPIAVNDEPTKTNGIQSRKKERESCLHQIQKGKPGKKKRCRKSVERGKLLDAAKKQIQLKEGGKMLTTVPSPISASDRSSTQPHEDDITTLSTMIVLKSTLTAKPDKGQLNIKKDDNTKLLTTSTPIPTLTVTPDKSSEHSEKDNSTMLESVSSVLLLSPASSDVMRMQSKEDNVTTLPLVSSPTTTKGKADLNVIDASSSKKSVTDAPTSQQGMKLLEPKREEAMQDFSDNDKFEPPVEDTAVNDAPWLPRIVRTRNAPKKLSQEVQYFCDRHRPHSPPPDWRMFAWERGDIDYTGTDRFSNILARIRTTIQQTEEEAMPIGVWL